MSTASFFVVVLGLLTWKFVSSQWLCRPDLPKTGCFGSSAMECEINNCCYSSGEEIPCYKRVIPPVNPQCVPSPSRLQCGMPKITSADECGASGCCWIHNDTEPFCYFPTPKYIIQSVINTDHGLKLILMNSVNKTSKLQTAAPISPLQLELTRETESRLHVKISDPNDQRYEIPESVLPVPPPPTKPLSNYYYDYKFPNKGEEFYMIISRRYYNEVLFNTTSLEFTLADLFLQIGTSLPANYNIYGLGEHKTSLRLKSGRGYTLWNYDVQTPENVNLYGSHPFYMEMRSGKAHGVFLRNSNGMDVVLDKTSLTYRVIGGVLDFYFFVTEMGQPDEVIHSYQEVIGRPAMPPYWALGFHQCRWGYKNIQQVRDVIANFSAAKLPLDGVWMDIDYMDGFKDFITDPTNFPVSAMKSFASETHQNGQHLVVIVDPGISRNDSYKPYTEGLQKDVFIKDNLDKIFVGKVWPGFVAYPDFFSPNATLYWQNQLMDFIEEVPVDGLWLDMNEPSNFCDGNCFRLNFSPERVSSFNTFNPPYNLNNQGTLASLFTRTLDVNSKHYGGLTSYNTHNLYGMTESVTTRKALLDINKGKRPFILSRSTFAGSGAHTAHWLGDNFSTEDDLYFSIPGILNFQMFGVPLVGADICGFGGNTTEELCARWMSVGAFYPFSRNHNTKEGHSQEPYRWTSVSAISQKFLKIRYSLLPYYYTLFFKAHHDPKDINILLPSAMVLKPLFFDFYKDPNTLTIDTQFLVGSALLVSPQLKLGDHGKSLNVYFPLAKWYDWYTFKAVTDKGGVNISIDTPLDHLPLHIRGNSIIPMQAPGLTTIESRKNPYSLLVALDVSGGLDTFGDIYLDDGETENATEYTYVTYTCHGQQLSSYAQGTGYASKNHLPPLTSVVILGVPNQPSLVALDGKPVAFNSSIVGDTFVLTVTGLNVTMDTSFNLDWV